MRQYRGRVEGLALSLVVAVGAMFASTASALVQPAEVIVQDLSGSCSYSVGGVWRPVEKSMALRQGTIIRTGADSTVDLLFNSSRTSLRLTPSSSLRLDKLNRETGLDMEVTDTVLTVLSGGIAGTQRKLEAPSRFIINAAGKTATIVGTEYFVRADGAVTVTSGTVSLNYNLPNNEGSIKVTVSAGYSFDPATGQVVPTTAEYLECIIAHITTTRHNALTFKVKGATLVVKPESFISPH